MVESFLVSIVIIILMSLTYEVGFEDPGVLIGREAQGTQPAQRPVHFQTEGGKKAVEVLTRVVLGREAGEGGGKEEGERVRRREGREGGKERGPRIY